MRPASATEPTAAQGTAVRGPGRLAQRSAPWRRSSEAATPRKAPYRICPPVGGGLGARTGGSSIRVNALKGDQGLFVESRHAGEYTSIQVMGSQRAEGGRHLSFGASHLRVIFLRKRAVGASLRKRGSPW